MLQELYKQLAAYGYNDEIIYHDNSLVISEKSKNLMPDSLFFIDMAFRVTHTYIFGVKAGFRVAISPCFPRNRLSFYASF